jgi:hypothetical protein
VAGFFFWPRSTPPVPVATPAAYESSWWSSALGGDVPVGAKQVAILSDEADSGLAAGTYQSLVSLGRSGAVAELAGTGRSAFGSYFSGAAPALCSDTKILAVAPVSLPVAQAGGTNTTNWAKILVLYDASCSGSPIGASSAQVLFLYGRLSLTWKLVHEYQIPGSSNSDPATNVSPASWQMTTFSSCAGSGQSDLIVVVDAFNLMCTAAATDGVALTVTSGWRTAAQQAALYAEAIKEYGSAAKAKQFVSPATDSSCTSLHCAGVAVDVAPTKKALTWLYATVGCIEASKVVIGPTSCGTNQAVLRMERYGFGAPAAQVPEYLEYLLPTTSATQNCNPAADTPVPVMVAQIWRCVLEENSVSAAMAKTVVASAEVVSLCESGWNADAVAFGGKWTKVVNPTTGKLVTNSGVFMLSDQEMRQYASLGSSGLNAVANINAGAQLWVASSSFESFGCATGHGTFDAGPALPQYGGPPVPSWAYAY